MKNKISFLLTIGIRADNVSIFSGIAQNSFIRLQITLHRFEYCILVHICIFLFTILKNNSLLHRISTQNSTFGSKNYAIEEPQIAKKIFEL